MRTTGLFMELETPVEADVGSQVQRSPGVGVGVGSPAIEPDSEPSPPGSGDSGGAGEADCSGRFVGSALSVGSAVGLGAGAAFRSEERRVGKEGRAGGRWSWYK